MYPEQRNKIPGTLSILGLQRHLLEPHQEKEIEEKNLVAVYAAMEAGGQVYQQWKDVLNTDRYSHEIYFSFNNTNVMEMIVADVRSGAVDCLRIDDEDLAQDATPASYSAH